MTTSMFRSSPALQQPARIEPLAGPPSRKQTLAIVSTSSKLCGIAAYTAALRRQLNDAFDITVFDLNQYLLRNPHRRVRRLADRHIKEIAHAIRHFDLVNLQLEYGTLGRFGTDIYRRFCWLTDAAPRLSVTFHTLLTPPSFDSARFVRALATLRFKDAARMQAEFSRAHLLSHGIARQLRRVQSQKGSAPSCTTGATCRTRGISMASGTFSTTRCRTCRPRKSRRCAAAPRAGAFRCSTSCRPTPC
jgi:hypothetical protein